MRWSSAYATAIAMGVWTSHLYSIAAFVPSSVRSASSTSALRVGNLGWDNENFLESLGNGDEAVNEANERYYAQSRFGHPDEWDKDQEESPTPKAPNAKNGTMGAELTEEMKAKVKASHTPEEEASQGGKMFRELLKKAQDGTSLKPPPQPPVVPQSPVASTPSDTSQLSVEQQAALFRQMMQQQQQSPPPPPVAPAYTSPPNYSTMPAARQPIGNDVAADGRRIGRNRDADAIVNSADVYFAQLKRDSTIRNDARLTGDADKANQVFVDPSIREIQMHTNPYMEEARAKEKAMLETSVDEMLDPRMFAAPPPKPKSYSGVSYKEKLERKRAQINTSSGTNSDVSAETKASTSTQSPVQPAKKEDTPPKDPEIIPTPSQPVASESAKDTWAEKLVTPSSTSMSASRTTADTVSRPAAGSDAMRADLRTVMGLLCKHRGGPGFGVGRIIGAERARFESLVQAVTGTLREEALLYPDSELDGEGIDLQIAKQNAPTLAVSSLPTPASDSVAASSSSVNVDGMIACIEGAILMYKNSPPELLESVLVTLRAALLSAVNTCNIVVGDSAPTPTVPSSDSSVQSNPARIQSMVACMEGAIVMYKNSPADIQSSVLITLRAALLAAVNTCNTILAEKEIENVQAYQAAATSAGVTAEPKSKTKPEFYNVVSSNEAGDTEATPAESASAPLKMSYSGNDPNSIMMKAVFEKLSAAVGSGKMGLREDLKPAEASSLADDIADMRVLLVDELDNGIPESNGENTEMPNTSEDSSSKYQQMLAKARADKTAKKKDE
jgi:hypothetical protein